MGSTLGIKTVLAAAALAVIAGCGSTHSNARAATGPVTTLSPATSTPVSTTPTTVGNSGANTSATSSGAAPTAAPTTAAAPAAAGGCLASQLAVEIGPSNGAAGSVRLYQRLQERLDRYMHPLRLSRPSDAQRHRAAHTHRRIRGPSAAVPSVPEKLVTLVPGAKADFDMGFPAATGYGNADCPTSTRVEFTAPNDFQSLIVTLAIRPYGGADIAQLHCGEIHVSPVYAAP